MLIQAERVSHRLGGRLVLDDVSLTVNAGEFIALLGPSGAGKTTLLGILGGLTTPNAAGAVLVGAGRPRISWAFQSAPSLLQRSALENVALGGLARGLDRDAAVHSAASTLERFGLADKMSARVRLLSGGERQRVSLARALESGAEILLADEPTASLDRSASDGVVDAMVDLTRDRVAVVVATHDPYVAGCADVRIAIRDGRVRASTARGA
ncbi:ABC transporter ATP-binding protein [Pseudactinotalea sp. HY160]|uniref:ABC transporter ATP-binding protein n=1 Tax=Pseudactinotalea sp. HY160 TaxID=2654490 RepID=UPI0018845A9E|nr:ATP-binding cassette domain-containing protein [Pseudactinotalea sp. HY160]